MAFTAEEIAGMKAAGLSDAAIAELAGFDPVAYQQQQAAIQGAISSKDAAALAAAQQAGISNIDYYVNPIGAGDIISGLTPSIMQNLGIYDPNYWAVMQTYGSSNDQSNPQDVTERSTFAVDPNAEYRLLDPSGKVIGYAKTPAEVRALVDAANQMSSESGKMAEWSLQVKTLGAGPANEPISTGWLDVATDTPDKLVGGTLGFLMDVAIPTILAGVFPPAGLLATMGTAAAGSIISSTLQGKSLSQIATSALIAAATAGALDLSGFSDAVSGVLNGTKPVIDKAAEEGAKQIAQAAADEIIVTATRGITAASLGSGIGGGLTNVIDPSQPPSLKPEDVQLPDYTKGIGTPPPDVAVGDILVTGQIPVPPPPVNAPVIGGGVGNNLFQPSRNYSEAGDQRTTTEQKAPEQTTTTTDEPPTDIVVTGNTQEDLLKSLLEGGASLFGGITDAQLNEINRKALDTLQKEYGPKTETETAGDGKGISTLDWIRAGLTGAGTIAAVAKNLGGGGSGGGGSLSPDTSGLNFEESTLTPTIPGGGTGGGTGSGTGGIGGIGGTGGIGGIGGTGGSGAAGGAGGGNRYPYTPTTYGRVGGDQETEFVFFTHAAPSGQPVTNTVPAAQGAAAEAAGLGVVTGPAGIGAADGLGPINASTFKRGGKVGLSKLTYDDLTPQEKNAVDYHRRNLAADMVRRNDDGSASSYIGAINELNGRETYYPTLWNGRELPLEEAERRVRQSGIEFPTYPDYETGMKREKRIHDDIMEPEMKRFLKGDKSFLKGYAEGGEPYDDMVKHLIEYHKNGGHQGPGPVKGIGSGQEDKIPAWLSDGEYVWSAQDVADLGDGSTDEGVRRLDKMREMVRRQAGRKNVKKIAKPQKGIDTMLKAVGGMV